MCARHEKIIVLDDEEVIASLIKTILQARGYKVFVAHHCGEAERILQEHSAGPVLLITDVVMPDMSGPELVARLRTSGLHIPVLYVSGYADMAGTSTVADLEEARLLTKPFKPADLLHAVEDVFSGTGA